MFHTVCKKVILSIFFSAFTLLSIQASPDPFVFIHPKPNSSNVITHPDILLRLTKEAFLLRHGIQVTIHDQQGHSYDYTLKNIPDENLLSLKTWQAFGYSDTIQVRVTLPGYAPFAYSFSIRAGEYNEKNPLPSYYPIKNLSGNDANEKASIINGVSVPRDFPLINTYVNGSTAPGHIFINNWGGSQYNMILQNDGTPVYYRKTIDHNRDFKVQANGYLTKRVYEDIHGLVMMDSSYQPVDTIHCIGYGTDEHECMINKNGNILLIALDYRQIDMRQVVAGGNAAAWVVGNHIQELDKDHNLLFEWQCWDNFNILGAEHEDLKNSFVDYIHMNSVDWDYDGNIICSSRHLSECTKISRQTGEIMWRLGGKYNQFTFSEGTIPFSYQHDFRAVPGKPNHYTVFDNGNFHGPFSRAIEYHIDPENMTATQVWEYRHTPDRYTWWMGNVQRLPNGNTLINWADGSLPKATEVTPEGSVVYDMGFQGHFHCYRTFRFEWEGMAKAPYLLVEPEFYYVNLIHNKFGDHTVDYYNIYCDTLPNPVKLCAKSASPLTPFYNYFNNKVNYIRVTAVNDEGAESPFSNEEQVFINFAIPGTGLIKNGQFNQQMANWLTFTENADATFTTNSVPALVINQSSPLVNTGQIAVYQKSVPLVKNRTYKLTFDANSNKSRVIDLIAHHADDHSTKYTQESFLITPQKATYSKTILMTRPTDLNAVFRFEVGGESGQTTIDNISLVEQTSDCLPYEDLVINHYNDTLPVSIVAQHAQTSLPVVYFINNALAKVVVETIDTIPIPPSSYSKISIYAANNCFKELFFGETPVIDKIQDEISIFPNPVKNEMVIRNDRLNYSDFRLRLYSAGGALVYEWHTETKEAACIVPTGHLNPGVYVAELSYALQKQKMKYVIRKKIIKIN